MNQKTDYPWDGKVTIEVRQAPEDPMALMLRIPGWATRAVVTVNGEPAGVELRPGTYATLRRRWSPGDKIELALPMDACFLRAHPLVEEARSQVAVMRGPIVYCLESPDLPKDVGIDDVTIVADTKWTPRCDKDLLGAAAVLEGEAWVGKSLDWTGRLYQRWNPDDQRRIRLTLIPYYAWANRGVSEMTVWMPVR